MLLLFLQFFAGPAETLDFVFVVERQFVMAFAPVDEPGGDSLTGIFIDLVRLHTDALVILDLFDQVHQGITTMAGVNTKQEIGPLVVATLPDVAVFVAQRDAVNFTVSNTLLEPDNEHSVFVDLAMDQVPRNDNLTTVDSLQLHVDVSLCSVHVYIPR